MATYTKAERKAIKAIYLSNCAVKSSAISSCSTSFIQAKFSSYQYWLNVSNHFSFFNGRFIRLKFNQLNTGQLLKLCSLVSTHRPVAPHSFLISCANLLNN